MSYIERDSNIKWRFHVSTNPLYLGEKYDISMGYREGRDRFLWDAKQDKYIKVNEAYRVDEHIALSLNKDALHALALALIEAGFIPEVITNNSKQLEATNKHLEDMRALTFKLIDKNNLKG